MVKPEESFRDWALARKVNQALWNQVKTDKIPHRVFARARNGLVYREGAVGSNAQKRISSKAALIPEVWSLVDQVGVLNDKICL